MTGILFFIAGAVVGVTALLSWQYQMYRKDQRTREAQAAKFEEDYQAYRRENCEAGAPMDPSCIDPTD